MEPGTAQFFLWGRTDTQRNPVYLQSVLGGKHSYGLRSKIYFKVSKPTAVYPHPLHSGVTISAGTVLPEKQHYTGTSLWADKALSLTLHITTYSSLHHYYFLSLSLVTSIFPLLSVECFFFPVFMLLLHKGKKKIKTQGNAHKWCMLQSCHFDTHSSFCWRGIPPSLYSILSPYFVSVHRNKQSKIFKCTGTSYSLCELLEWGKVQLQKRWKKLKKGNKRKYVSP